MSILKILSCRLTALSGNLETFEIRNTFIKKRRLKKLERLIEKLRKTINDIYEDEEKVRNTNF